MRKTINLSGTKTNEVLIKCPTDKRIHVRKILNLGVSEDSNISVFFGTNTAGQHIVFGDFAGRSGEAGVMDINESGDLNQDLKSTHDAGNLKGVIVYDIL